MRMPFLPLVTVGAIACSSSAGSGPGSSGGAASSSPPAAHVPVEIADPHIDANDTRRWFAGDLHMHLQPDGDSDVSFDQVVDSARAAHLDFLFLTPHIRPQGWDDSGAAHRRDWHAMAEHARAVTGITIIPGMEWTTRGGHFTVAGTELDALDVPANDFLDAAHKAGAIVSVNHPFALPMHMPGIPVTDYDLSYKVWTDHGRGFTAIDGAEILNLPLALANLINRPGGRTGEERAWTELDRIVHAEHRKMIAVGGSDDHHGHATATTWVLAAHPSEREILSALRAGETCIGGPQAGTFTAAGDDAAKQVHIGGAVTGAKVTLHWTGLARLFVDDQDKGEHDGGFTHDTGGTLHTYRIVVGGSRSGFIYANL